MLPLVPRSQFVPEPALNTAEGHTYHFRNLRRSVPLFYQHKCSLPTGGELMGCSSWSHALDDATEPPTATLLIEHSVGRHFSMMVSIG